MLLGDSYMEKLLHELFEDHAIPSSRGKRPDAAPGTEWFGPGVRETLYPLIDTAAGHQLLTLKDPPEAKLFFPAMELALRLALQEHDFVIKQRDQSRVLMPTGSGADYGLLNSRPSRI